MTAIKGIKVSVSLEKITDTFNLKSKMIKWAKKDGVLLPQNIIEWEIISYSDSNITFRVFGKHEDYEFRVSIYDILNEAEKAEKRDFAFSDAISSSDPQASDEDVVIDYKILDFNTETEMITMDVTYA